MTHQDKIDTIKVLAEVVKVNTTDSYVSPTAKIANEKIAKIIATIQIK